MVIAVNISPPYKLLQRDYSFVPLFCLQPVQQNLIAHLIRCVFVGSIHKHSSKQGSYIFTTCHSQSLTVHCILGWFAWGK